MQIVVTVIRTVDGGNLAPPRHVYPMRASDLGLPADGDIILSGGFPGIKGPPLRDQVELGSSLRILCAVQYADTST